MASFIQKLRMNNIFPTGGMNLGYSGQLPMYGGNDPMTEITDNYAIPSVVQRRQAAPAASTGALNRIADRNTGNDDAPLRFGGVVNDSNPGAGILARSAANAERIWGNYGKPQETAGEVLARAGIKPNDQDPGFTQAVKNLDDNKALKEELTRSQINENKARTGQINDAKNLTEDKAWKVITIADPNDPTKTINARYNSISNKTEPIVLPNNGTIVNQPKQADLVKQKEAEAAKVEADKSFREKAQAALDTLNELSSTDEKGNEVLKPNTQTATGWSANIPGLEYMPFGVGTGAASAHASIDRLKNLLTLDLLQEIKKQSKSGATGFGQMNLRELGVLENSASKLAKLNQDEPAYAEELKRVREKLTGILAQKNGFDTPGPTGDTGTEDNKKPNTKVDAQTPPEAPDGWEYVRNAANNGWTARPKGSKQ